MNAIGDRVDIITRKHESRYLAVFFGHAVDVMTEIEREIGHVQHALAAEHVFHFFDFFFAENAMN